MNGIAYFLPYSRLDEWFAVLHGEGYRIIGPQLRDGAVVYDTLRAAQELPWGVVDTQAAGHYRAEITDKAQAFAWVNGPQAIKPQLFKPREVMWRVQRDEQGKLIFAAVPPRAEKLALLGVRPCDVRAMYIQDNVLNQGVYKDHRYESHRADVLVIAMNCTRVSENCFCVSAGGDPQADHRADIQCTEVEGGFVVSTASELGTRILAPLNLEVATASQNLNAMQGIAHARSSQKKTIPSGNLQALLFANLDHPQWQVVADQCLACGNCTQVCPTCFCHAEHDEGQLGTDASEHIREWDSCFNADHAYIHGWQIRDDIHKRYRQWLTHKFGSWHEQFGESGCVGCGRCIAWCPAGIDVTHQLNAIALQDP